MFIHTDLVWSAFEMWQKHGMSHAKAIRTLRDIYSSMFGSIDQSFWDRVQQYETYIRSHTPKLYAEIQWIAKGADIDILQIVALNARSELLKMDIVNTKEWSYDPNECTTFFTKIKHQIVLAQNRDFNKDIGVHTYISHVDGGSYHISMITEPWIIWKMGINNHGLAVGLNFLEWHKKEVWLPIHCLMKLILTTCQTIDDAKNCIHKHHTGKTWSLTLSDGASGLCVEFCDDKAYFLDQKDTFVRTNHYIHPDILEKHPDYLIAYKKNTYASSQKRYDIAEQRVKDAQTLKDIQKILHDTSCEELSISRLTPNKAGTISVCSIVFDHKKHEMSVYDLREWLNDTWTTYTV